MAKKQTITHQEALPPVAAPVVSPFALKQDRLRRQQEVHNEVVELFGEFLADVASDCLRPAAFSQKAETFLRNLPEADRAHAIRSINGIVGRLLSILPKAPTFFTGQ